MLFNSIDFLVFAIVFFALWPLFNRKNNARWGFLTAMSFVFYGWWDWRFLFLILGSGMLDYFCGLAIPRDKKRAKLYLILSLLGNLGGLAVFKYSVFFAQVLEQALGAFSITVDLQGSIPEFALILPVGISFYTFQSMSYTLDIYRGRLEPTRNVLHFFSYLAMFPQLVAGPIVRARDLLGQLAQERKSNWLEKWHAIKLVAYGLFQKMVIADNLAFLIDSAYQNKAAFDGTIFWWVVAIAFGFQIYADFCGYSLIARGLAKFMGYHFKMNFNHPYISSSVREFWTRWHISLSSWFRDYVYIPLGGSRHGVGRGIFYLWVTMVVSGLWHGANYTFIVWGALHAFFVTFERFTKWPKRLKKLPGGHTMAVFIVFILAMVAWVFFRADNISQAGTVIGKLFSWKSTNMNFLIVYLNEIIFLMLALGIEMVIYMRSRSPKLNRFIIHSNMDIAGVAIAIVMLIFFRGEGAQFIYFQF